MPSVLLFLTHTLFLKWKPKGGDIKNKFSTEEHVCGYVSEQVLPHALNGEHICCSAKRWHDSKAECIIRPYMNLCYEHV